MADFNSTDRRLGVALYGDNGHQVHERLADHPRARLVAIAEFPRGRLPVALRGSAEVKEYSNLTTLLRDPRVELVVLCSPRRVEQAGQAIRALRAGRHVYAEKPCALSEMELEDILAVAKETGCHFREMAGTAFEQPYFAMREIVRSGRLGRVVQVVAEKSYPYHERRPRNEEVDGGLILQCGVHAMRFVGHVAGVRVCSVRAMETTTGNPEGDGGLRMAACLMMELEGGGLASITANYLNPKGTGIWGYESLRIFGEHGMVESLRGGAHTRLVIGGTDHGPLSTETPGIDYLDAYLGLLTGAGDMPLTVEEELLPTRWVLRAKAGVAAASQAVIMPM
ncbi:MAG: oxidoreductase domain protein [Rariglobus sp.]|jgi:predicted dehydrogenase|nr:oxidoreductase domain protein [Rariglobus sp.]